MDEDEKDLVRFEIAEKVLGWIPYYEKGNVWKENPEWYDKKSNFKIKEDLIDVLKELI